MVNIHAEIRSGAAPIAGLVKRILVVDDDASVQGAVSSLLEDEGYEVCTSGDGNDALARLRRLPADLVILDLCLPGMDGWQFRTIQRADPALCEIPVIVVSCDGTPDGQAINANHFLRKPFKADELLLIVERLLLGCERQRLSKRLGEADGIALLGTMAASVGHEINNPLMYVLGNLEILQPDIVALSAEPEAERRAVILADIEALLRDIRMGAERIREVVGGLRWLSCRRADSDAPIDICRVLETSIAIAQNEIRHRARLERRLRAVPAVQGNEARLGQVFVNLLVNAGQSMPAGAMAANRILVATSVRDDFVSIEVSDTGPGIDPELHTKIFEPFFTTKAPGSGTGLGLAISQDIVREHGGRIELESAPGRGSLFRVLLPYEPVRALAETAPVPFLTAPAAKSIRVLVIDDDPLVRTTVERMLCADTVVGFGTARAALRHLTTHGGFDAILCDLMMPDTMGMDFHAEVAKLDAALSSRFVFMTGGAFASEARAFRRRSRATCLDKPFTREALRVALLAVTEPRPPFPAR